MRKRALFILFLVLLALILFGLYTSRIVNPIVLKYGEAELNRLLVKSCNSAILNISTVNYDDLFDVKYDEKGNITSIIANAQSINSVANSLAIETQRELDINSSLGISVPIGTLSGIAFLSGRGESVSFSVNPLGNITCDFFTTFTSVGINQTSHKVYIRINATASLILPFSTHQFTKTVDYLISECLIIGQIPDTYLNLLTPNT